MKYHALIQLTVKHAAASRYADGQGLWLHKPTKQAGKWIQRIYVDGKRHDMGLGRWPDVSIAEAREKAALARRSLRDGSDSIQARQAAKQRVYRLTVAEAVDSCFKARQAELKGDGKAGRWMSPLRVHAIPKIGKKAIEDIDQHKLKMLLEPIWHEKAVTARKVLNRMSLTLKHSAALGLDVDLQAVMKTQAQLSNAILTTQAIQHDPNLLFG